MFFAFLPAHAEWVGWHIRWAGWHARWHAQWAGWHAGWMSNGLDGFLVISSMTSGMPDGLDGMPDGLDGMPDGLDGMPNCLDGIPNCMLGGIPNVPDDFLLISSMPLGFGIL